MRRIIAGIVLVFALLFAPAVTATGTQPTSASETTAIVPNAGRAIYISNSLYSTGSVKMCTGHNGTGTCYNVPRNSKSPAPVRSVYGQRFCLTMVNSSYVREGGYWNTKWYTWGPHAAVKIC